MSVYVDISFFIALFNSITAYAFTRKLKRSKVKKISTILFIFIESLCVIFYRFHFKWITLVYLVIINLFYFSFFLKDVLINIFFYYSLVGIQLLFKEHIYLNNFLPLALDLEALFIVGAISLFSLLIRVVFIKIIRYLKNQKFIYSVDLFFNNKHLKMKGYYDSGNCSTYDSIPIIFIKSDKVKIPMISTIKYHVDKLIDGEIIITGKRKIRQKVKISEVSIKYDFNGCDCLLNVFLL